MIRKIQIIIFGGLLFSAIQMDAREFKETSFLIAEINASNIHNQQLWNFLGSNNRTGIEADLHIEKDEIYIATTDQKLEGLLSRIYRMTENDSSKVFPVFFHLDEQPELLDSIIQQSLLSRHIFHLPRGEAWPTTDYLIQANRRILFFVTGNFDNNSEMLHKTENYVLKISADDYTGTSAYGIEKQYNNFELFAIDEFEKLPTQTPPNSQSRNLVPDYINFLLE
ncbi:MAG: hypothetical protein ACP5D9_20095, partial [Mariniphaga sp.]